MSGKLALVVIKDDGVRAVRDVVYLPDVTAVAFKMAINEGRIPALKGYQAYTTHSFSHQALEKDFGIGRGNLLYRSPRKGETLLQTLRPHYEGVMAVYGAAAQAVVADMKAEEAASRAAWREARETRWEQGAPTSGH